MNIIQVASEAVPFAKTGGLADVVGALPKYFTQHKHQVTLFLPLYKQVKESVSELITTGTRIKVPIGGQTHTGVIWEAKIPDSSVKVFLLQHDEFFHRDNLYGTPDGDYPDNAARFIFLSRGVLEAIPALKLEADVIHCHDWQSALIPVYLKTLYRPKKELRSLKTLFTVHNLAYQGLFKKEAMALTGLDPSLYNSKQLEFWDKVNFIKGGLVFADLLSTVSQRYAEEIQTEEFGCGLEGVLSERAAELSGIINGIDYSDWDPQVDRFIPAQYSMDDLSGKAECKKLLQQSQGLSPKDVPLLGIVSRLAEQKGLDILVEIFDELMELDLQFILLGTGEEKYHKLLEEKAKKYKDKVVMNITFDNQLAHQITAGADMILLPSRYEPCGLNQLYALKYGSVPVVRETGGPADTIIDYSPDGLKKKESTGFSFKEYKGSAFLDALKRAVEVYQDKKTWRSLMKIGMAQDWSWNRSAREYLKLYDKLLKN